MEQEIEQLNRILKEWRAAHRPPTPLPEEVWKRALVIAGRAGFAATAKALKLDYSALRRRAQNHPARPCGPEFVEIFGETQTRMVDCVVEVQSSRGSRLRIEAKGVHVSELSTWVRDFRD